METITISLGSVLYFILLQIIIFCIIYYGILTDKEERQYNTTEEFTIAFYLTLIIFGLYSIIKHIFTIILYLHYKF